MGAGVAVQCDHVPYGCPHAPCPVGGGGLGPGLRSDSMPKDRPSSPLLPPSPQLGWGSAPWAGEPGPLTPQAPSREGSLSQLLPCRAGGTGPPGQLCQDVPSLPTPPQGMLCEEDGWDSVVSFLPLWQVRRQQSGRPSTTLPKKGSASAQPEPEEPPGQEQNVSCVPAAPTYPSRGILAEAGLAQLHGPQASAGTGDCWVLPPGLHEGSNGLGSPKPRLRCCPEEPGVAPSSPAQEAHRAAVEMGPGAEARARLQPQLEAQGPGGGGGWEGVAPHADTYRPFLVHPPFPWAPTCWGRGAGL